MKRSRSPLATRLPRFGAYANPGTIDALRRYKSGLGAATETGVLVSKGVSLGAGAAATAALTAVGGAALGAAAGSVVPIVGTVIGAAIGFLTEKLFGTADYAQVYSDVSNNLQLFEAYEGVAGQYPGRIYGWPEIHYVFYGAMFYGMFPGNGTTWGTCTQASITKNINECGTSAWMDDWIGAGAPKPGSGSNNIMNLIGTALAQGVRDPRQIASQYLVPGAESVALGKNNSWISVKNSRNPQLYTQMLTDIADVVVSTAYPSTPVYYGSIPGSSPAPSAAPTAPVVQAAPVVSNTPFPTAPITSAPTPSPSGTVIKAGTGATMVGSQGTWSFGSATTAAGDQAILSGVATTGYGVGMTMGTNGTPQLTDANNNIYQWTGSGWAFLSSSAPASSSATPVTSTTPTPTAVSSGTVVAANSPAGTTLSPGSNATLQSSAGTWSFGSSNDGQGNYQILLNGSAAAAGNSNATQLQINSSGTVIATVSNGATYSWGSGGWNTVSAPLTSVAVSTPSTISSSGATIIPGGGSQLITAQGEWTFSTQDDGTGNYYLLLNGSLAGAEAGVQLSILNSTPTLLRNDGSTWSWGGTGWTQLTAANTTPETTADALLYPAAPVDDSATYATSTDPSTYSGGYDGYSSEATPAPVTPTAPVATTMSTTEKVLLYGGGGLALLALTVHLTRHRGAR